MHFTKMHGAGNDFIIIDDLLGEFSPEELSSLAAKLCTRRMSVGADGMMVVTKAVNGGDYGMLFYNSDGSLGEMCGNGARCIARYGFEHGLAGETQHVETTAGLVTGQRISERMYRVRLNDPSVADIHRRVGIGGQVFDCTYFELGDPGIPHAVIILENWDSMDRASLKAFGSALRYAAEFPKGANVSFVRFMGENHVKAITFERGVEDFTLACGTGCGSIASALTLLGLCSAGQIRVDMPGGTLFVNLTRSGDTVKDIFLTGPTELVCEGEISDEHLY